MVIITYALVKVNVDIARGVLLFIAIVHDRVVLIILRAFECCLTMTRLAICGRKCSDELEEDANNPKVLPTRTARRRLAFGPSFQTHGQTVQ
jgi:hypothetical protein